MGINFKNGPTSDRGAVPNPAKRRRHAFSAVAFLAALAAGLLFLLPGGLLQAQDGGTMEYAENGTDPVATYTGLDPEGRPIYWSLLESEGDVSIDDTPLLPDDIADKNEFTISSDGVLSFRLPPDFEMPMSRATIDGGVVAEGTLAARNVYKIVVVASDDAPGADMAGATTLTDEVKMTYHKVTVHVTDMDEDGSISFSAQQPQVGVTLTATLKDPDSTEVQIDAAKWKWYHCPAVGTACAVIPGETTKAYTPGAVIVGRDLMAVATYKDASGSKEVKALAANAVRAVPSGGNAAPVFPSSASSRSVDENSPPGTPVGAPVAAGDAGDILTYALVDDDTDTANDDNGLYSVDPATGQITVGSRAMLNAEAAQVDDRVPGTDGFQHQVMVRAIDPHADPNADGGDAIVSEGNSDTVPVTITVKDVTEAPRITGGPTMTMQEENSVSTDATPDNISDDVIVTTYKATDPESDEDEGFICSECAWSISGPDSALFDIEESGEAGNTVARLTFKKAPNFEKPADANMDNVYMVTVVVTDPGMDTSRQLGVGKLTAMRDVAINVTNANDDGEITLSSQQPKVGVDFTADLSDEDGVVGDVKWQWYQGDPADTNTPIAKAKSATYTPKAGDLDSITLYVLATYTDSFGSTATTGMAANLVLADLENKAPVFRDANENVITSDIRSIAEDAVTDATPTPPVSPGVIAIDPNGDPGTAEGILTYTLGGRDANSFEIAQATGEISVKAGTKLDYETKKSYTVTVIATDPSQATATIAITINVTDVNEPPVIGNGEDEITVTVAEGTRTIKTFRWRDPEGRPVYWSTEGTDAEDFSISSSGALTFKASPDYEAPKQDGSTDNTYTVTVTASDDAPGAGDSSADPIKRSSGTVTVKVTNKVEKGTVSFDRKLPVQGITIEAELVNSDNTGTPGYTWYNSASSTEPIQTSSATYEPDVDDVGKTLTVKATYEDHDGDEVVVSSGRTGVVRAARTDPVNIVPTFPQTTVTKIGVREDIDIDTSVGSPFRATDEDSTDRSYLTYEIGSSDQFAIDLFSGQLSTKAALDYETAIVLDPERGSRGYTVTVTAMDPHGGSSTGHTVTINVTNVNERPEITSGVTRVKKAEYNSSPEDVGYTKEVASYGATDPDADPSTCVVASCQWSLTGTDATHFEMGKGENYGQVSFKELPNYDKPVDSGRNNVYEMTVQVSDGTLTATRKLKVTVTDVAENGIVEISSVQPKVAVELTASLEDDDGGVKDVTWQWYDGAIDTDNPPNLATNAIDGATSATYTPVVDDVGKTLYVRAAYTDRLDEQSAMMMSTNDVTGNTDNRAPMFRAGGAATGAEITSDTREIGENMVAEEAGNVGDPVIATDPNGDGLTYRLGGADMASFTIGGGDGQLKTKAKLDYEDKNTYMVTVTATDPNGEMASVDVTIKVTDEDEAPKIIAGGLVVRGTSDTNYAENGKGMVATYGAAGPDAADANWSLSGADAGALSISSAGVLTFMASPNYESPADANTDNIYMVMVNANDGTNDAMKAVSVRVTNVEEMGEVTLWAGTDALTMAPQVGETITGAVMDPDGNPGDMPPIAMDTTINDVTWQWSRTMDTADMSSWMDIQDATDAAYMVMEGDTGYHLRVMATYTDAAGTAMEYSMPTMVVTAVGEIMGEVTLWAGADPLTMAPQVGDTITGAVMDQDGGVTGESWQWSRTTTPAMMDSWMDIAGETNAAYTVTEGDTGYYLRVMATYTDAVGTDTAMEYSMPTMMVTAVDEADRTRDAIRLEIEQAILDAVLSAGIDDAERSAIEQLILEFALTPSS